MPTFKVCLLNGSSRCLQKPLGITFGNEVTVGWKWPPLLLLGLSERGRRVYLLTEVWVSLITNRDHQNPGDVSSSLSLLSEVLKYLLPFPSCCSASVPSKKNCVSLLEQKGPQRGTGLTPSTDCWAWGETIWVKPSMPAVIRKGPNTSSRREHS